MMVSKRLNTGLYLIEHKDKHYHVEDIQRASDGDCGAGWILYQINKNGREYMNDFDTKRSAIKALSTL